MEPSYVIHFRSPLSSGKADVDAVEGGVMVVGGGGEDDGGGGCTTVKMTGTERVLGVTRSRGIVRHIVQPCD